MFDLFVKAYNRTGLVKRVKRAFVVAINLFVTLSFSLSISALPITEDTIPSDITVDSSTPGKMTITTGDKSIINYRSFDISGGEKVQFNQPSSGSIALNRVTGPSGSSIDGELAANGRIFLVNPNGVFIGSGGNISAAGFVASGLNIYDSDFTSGNYNFTGGNGSVTNNGTIKADSVGLVGAQVVNAGTIEGGKVLLAAGGAVSFGDDLMNFAVSGDISNALAKNSGTIKGGNVVMAASAAQGIVDAVVNNEGTIEAGSVESGSGSIKLVASNGGNISNSGTLASATVELAGF